jgi:hypothetical protein
MCCNALSLDSFWTRWKDKMSGSTENRAYSKRHRSQEALFAALDATRNKYAETGNRALKSSMELLEADAKKIEDAGQQRAALENLSAERLEADAVCDDVNSAEVAVTRIRSIAAIRWRSEPRPLAIAIVLLMLVGVFYFVYPLLMASSVSADVAAKIVGD